VVKISYEKKDGIFVFENLLIIIFILQKKFSFVFCFCFCIIYFDDHCVFGGGVHYSPFLKKKAIYGEEK